MKKTLNLTITIFQEADFNAIIQVNGDSGPLNITGYTFLGKIKSNTQDINPVALFDFTILDQTANTGQVKWQLSSTDANGIPVSNVNCEESIRPGTPYLYDIIMTDSLGTKTRIIQGTAFVSPSVTP